MGEMVRMPDSSSMIKYVLITGGAGRLAKFGVKELQDKYELTLFDRVTPDQALYPWKTDLPLSSGT